MKELKKKAEKSLSEDMKSLVSLDGVYKLFNPEAARDHVRPEDLSLIKNIVTNKYDLKEIKERFLWII